MMIACDANQYEVVKYLSKERNIKLDENEIWDVLNACNCGDICVVQYLTRNFDLASFERVLTLIRSGVLQLEDHSWLLHKMSVKLSEIGINSQAPIDVIDGRETVTPLFLYALSGARDKCWVKLIGRHADVRAKSSKGRTILHAACAGGNLEMVKYLVEVCGLNVFDLDNEDRQPIYYAMRSIEHTRNVNETKALLKYLYSQMQKVEKAEKENAGQAHVAGGILFKGTDKWSHVKLLMNLLRE